LLKQRIITGLILAPIVIAGIFLLSAINFAVFIGVIVVIGGWEWANLAGLEGKNKIFYATFIALGLVTAWFIPSVVVLGIGFLWWLLAFYLVLRYPAVTEFWQQSWKRCVIGVLVLVPAWKSLQELKTYEDSNYLILLLMLLIWGADIGAYFSGKAFGNRKLAPNVSPGKSMAGLYGGIATAALIVILMSLVWARLDLASTGGLLFFSVCLFVVLVSVLGDLTESMFKRFRGIKDSSSLLPGHGGVMDRIDSLVAAGPVFALMLIFLGWK